MKYDFGGWATKNDIKCTDGRVIRKNAFAHNDGQKVPLVWNHNHNDPTNVLGYAILENRPEGVYAYGNFNESEYGQLAKTLVQHGDVNSLSIFANGLKQTKNRDVLDGQIRELSLVIAPANKGAKIDDVVMHGEVDDDALIFSIDEDNCSFLEHAEREKEDPLMEDKKENEKTVQDVIDSMTDEQRETMYLMIGQVMEDAGIETDDEGNIVKHSDYEEGGEIMKMNVFDRGSVVERDVLSHSDQQAILALAKQGNVGSLKSAMEYYADENELSHDALAGGFVQTGDGSVTTLFPDYKDVRPGAPELITNDQGWISVVMNKVHKSPISRIRTRQVDIRNIDALRAKGYPKGKQKKLAGNFKLVRRTTDPHTVYVKNALHRDDVVDIVDFDYVQYLYGIDRMNLYEELAMAIMIGDGREEGDDDKIPEDKIRPIWLDDDLYTIHVDLNVEDAKKELQGTNTGANFGENYIMAEAMINTMLYAREKYKGSGTPDYYCTPHMLNIMLLARDLNGRRIYSTKDELATAFNVGEIITVEQFEGKTRTTDDNKKKKLLGIIVNPNDYSLGATKGGELTHFTDFDIDFNQLKSLLETRCSGALTKVYSAIAIEEDVTPASGA